MLFCFCACFHFTFVDDGDDAEVRFFYPFFEMIYFYHLACTHTDIPLIFHFSRNNKQQQKIFLFFLRKFFQRPRIC